VGRSLRLMVIAQCAMRMRAKGRKTGSGENKLYVALSFQEETMMHSSQLE
jgi:hypothetical protein